MMYSTNESDPFLQVQADVQTQLSHIRPLFTSYLRIQSLLPSPSNPSPELLSATSELNAALTTLSEDLLDLRDAVAAVQSDPYRYGLEIDEVSRRRRFVDEVAGEIEDMQDELSNKTAPNGNGKGKGRQMPEYVEGQEDTYREFEEQQQVQMFAEQDTQLDSVSHTIGNLRAQASEMGRELEEQREMLEVVDSMADRVGGRISRLEGSAVEGLEWVLGYKEASLASDISATTIPDGRKSFIPQDSLNKQTCTAKKQESDLNAYNIQIHIIPPIGTAAYTKQPRSPPRYTSYEVRRV
ncbi:hypothetical protein B7494_g1943 [Chlorociboria aeruginascens]|nr:hypothetical protein B7494_g1943 [Chlorociboria aeruginascens]